MLRHNFSTRAPPHTMPEWMDGSDVDAETFRQCVKSLARVNLVSFGHRPTMAFARQAAQRTTGPLRLLDVGSGYGDTLRTIARDLAKRGLAAELVGADLNPHATAAAKAASPATIGSVSLTFRTADARELAQESARFDAIVCALFTHHLEDDEVVAFLRDMDSAVTGGWFINDLYRSKLAAVGFGALATLAGQHPFVRHDGPVSFARAFRAEDWRRHLSAAGIPANGVSMAIGAPFRLCLTRWHG